MGAPATSYKLPVWIVVTRDSRELILRLLEYRMPRE